MCFQRRQELTRAPVVRQPAQPAQRDSGVARALRGARGMGQNGHRAAAKWSFTSQCREAGRRGDNQEKSRPGCSAEGRCLPVNLHCRIDVDRSIYRGRCGGARGSSPGRGLASSFGIATVSGSLTAGTVQSFCGVPREPISREPTTPIVEF
jgi:hypothetical protein